jgi:hypothetical protein
MGLALALALDSLWVVASHLVSLPSSKELITHVTLELDGFLEIVCLGSKH